MRKIRLCVGLLVLPTLVLTAGIARTQEFPAPPQPGPLG